jgi:hypothetical protein
MKVDKRPCEPLPVQRKDFRAALGTFLAEAVPSLGHSLMLNAVLDHLLTMIDTYLPAAERMRPGQVMWYAVDSREKGGYGKRIEDTAILPVIVDLVTDGDIQAFVDHVPRRERQKRVAVRLHQQSHEQGGVFTYADTGALMRLSPSTVGMYIREYERETGQVVPRRGTLHDMGPTLTHKRIICIKHLKEGKSVQQTALETDHSPEAITRYVQDFKRVHVCLREGWDLGKIAAATGLSRPLITQYVDMIQENDTVSFDEVPF